MKEELQNEFREQFAKDLRKSAFKDFANAAFDASKISEVEALRESKTKELEKLRGEFEEIGRNPENHKRELRDRMKEIKAAMEHAEKFIKDCNITISTIQQSVQNQRQKGAQYLERAEFTEKFTLEDHAD